MTQIRHLRLVLPGALSQLRQQQGDASLSSWWQLLRHAACSRQWNDEDAAFTQLEAWQHAVIQTLPEVLRHHGLAAAALSWRGSGGSLLPGTWLQAEWVHLSAGLDDVRLALVADLTPDEESQLVATVQPVLSLASFDWLTPADSRQPYLWCERSLDLVTHAPRQGFTTRNYSVMPQGAHGGQLRRIMTELQMVLHQHPLNAQRERQGKLPINALWLWGAGKVASAEGRLAQRVLGNHPYVVGLAEHLNQACWPVPQQVDDLLAVKENEVLLVLPELSLQEIDTHWLQPLQQALQRSAIGRLDIHLDHWRATQQGGRRAQLQRYLTSATHQLADILA